MSQVKSGNPRKSLEKQYIESLEISNQTAEACLKQLVLRDELILRYEELVRQVLKVTPQPIEAGSSKEGVVD